MKDIDILAAYRNSPPVMDFVLPGMLAGSVGMFLSAGGVGKSMLALEIACGIACNTYDGDIPQLQPRDRVPMRVAYLSAEDPEAPLLHRLHAMGSRFSEATRLQHAEHLRVTELVGDMPDLMDPAWHNDIVSKYAGARLIIIDTLTRFHTLDENSNGDMSQLVSRLEWIAKQCKSAVLVIHHANKGMAISGRGDEQQAARGASALIDNSRWAANLVGMSPEEAQVLCAAPLDPAIGDDRINYVRFCISKQNYGKPALPQWYTRETGGVLVPVTLHPFERRRKIKEPTDGL